MNLGIKSFFSISFPRGLANVHVKGIVAFKN